MKKRVIELQLMLLFLFSVFPAWAADGDTFTANTVEGVEMTFKVISEEDKTCQVGDGDDFCIPVSTTGIVTIPQNVNGYSVITIGSCAFD